MVWFVGVGSKDGDGDDLMDVDKWLVMCKIIEDIVGVIFEKMIG